MLVKGTIEMIERTNLSSGLSGNLKSRLEDLKEDRKFSLLGNEHNSVDSIVTVGASIDHILHGVVSIDSIVELLRT